MNTNKISTLSLLIAVIFGWLITSTTANGGATLVPMHSVWKYRDDGSNQGAAWRMPAFNDSSWASGQAQLGYGNGDEVTVVSYGSDYGNKYITTYFRHSFVVANAQAYSNLTLRLLRDDGAVVYLNGIEAARVGMLPGPIDYLSRATDCALEGKLFVGAVLRAGLLVNGTNVLAVEIHQVSKASTQVMFDLGLLGITSPEPLRRTRRSSPGHILRPVSS